MDGSTWLLICAFAMVFCALGASVIEAFVNYRTWRLTGPAEFQAYH